MNNQKSPLVIFEIANNHMGDIKYFKTIIDNFYALKKKFNKSINFALKFQFRELDSFINPSFIDTNHKGVERFVTTKLSVREWNNIISFAKNKFDLICTPFDEISINRILKSKDFNYLKVASCSADDWPFLEHLAKEYKKNKKKIICSLGGLTDNEIFKTISFFTNRNLDVRFLYCVAKYPTNKEDLNLNYFLKLKDKYGDLIQGFSTHETPELVDSGSIAYSMGARIFEKHIGIVSKKYGLNKYSSNPTQTEDWLKKIDNTIKFCGTVSERSKQIKDEKIQLRNFKRGVYAKTNIPRGSTLKKKHIKFQFPNVKNQILSNDISKFFTFKLKKKISEGEPIFFKNIELNNTQKKIGEIRNKILELLDKTKLIIPKQTLLEISYHYGLSKFYKFGISMVTIYNNKYCKKLIFLLGKQKHPEQYHKIKKETFFIVYGRVKVNIKKLGRPKEKIKTRTLNVGDLLTIKPGEIHSFQSVTNYGSIIEELSSQSIKRDSYYVDKKINQNKDRKSFIRLN